MLRPTTDKKWLTTVIILTLSVVLDWQLLKKLNVTGPYKKEESTLIILFLLGLDCDICPIHGSSELELFACQEEGRKGDKKGNETVKYERQDGRKPVF